MIGPWHDPNANAHEEGDTGALVGVCIGSPGMFLGLDIDERAEAHARPPEPDDVEDEDEE